MPENMPRTATVDKIAASIDIDINVSVNGKPYVRRVEPRMLLVEFCARRAT